MKAAVATAGLSSSVAASMDMLTINDRLAYNIKHRSEISFHAG
jgi:hypothetical protein